MQPTQQQRNAALQVDATKVIEAEAAEYTKMIQQLVRNNAVLSTALDDQQAHVRELEAKVRALTGGPAQSSAVSRPGASGGRPGGE